jgi:hypothetical protein
MPPGQTLDWGGKTPRARATGGKETLINAEPGRSRRKALGLPSQGRHRPRSSLLVARGDAHQAIHDWSARPTPPYSQAALPNRGLVLQWLVFFHLFLKQPLAKPIGLSNKFENVSPMSEPIK